MKLAFISAFIVYFSIILTIGVIAYRRTQKSLDFTLGNRSLGYWVTALAAHASETSSWLFMALPAAVYSRGLVEAWTAIGLVFFMFLNWRLVAPKIRSLTEQLQSVTLCGFFEKRFQDNSGILRFVSAIFCLIYFIFYISAGLVAMGLLFESIFNLHYIVGLFLGSTIVFLTLLGGYVSISWIDFFQGLFLLAVIIFVPIVAFTQINGFSEIISVAADKNLLLNIFPVDSFNGFKSIIFASFGWGLGYFGQPQVLTKFMGINDVGEMRKAQWIGIGWQVLSYVAAIFVGIIGIAFFKNGIYDSQFIFVNMVKIMFPQFLAGFVLCAVIAAAINVMSSQVLVAASVITEDFYKKLIKNNNNKYNNNLARLSVICICIFSGVIAFFSKNTAIYDLVFYAWTGLGCSFGPLVLVSLHTKINNKYAALAGLLVGGLTAGLWPLFNSTVPAMIVGFVLSLFVIFMVNKVNKSKNYDSGNSLSSS